MPYDPIGQIGTAITTSQGVWHRQSDGSYLFEKSGRLSQDAEIRSVNFSELSQEGWQLRGDGQARLFSIHQRFLTVTQAVPSVTVTRVDFDSLLHPDEQPEAVSWAGDRFRIEKPGFFLAHTNLQMDGRGLGNRRIVGIQVNGEWRGRNEVQSPSGSGIQLTAVAVFTAVEGDIVTGVFYQDTGSDLNIESGVGPTTQMTVIRLGP